MSNIEKYNQNILPEFKEIKSELDNFMKEIGVKGNVKFEKTKPFANNSKYYEIGYLETQLDRKFSGLWSIHNQQVHFDITGITVSLELRVFNPVAHVWINRTGIAHKDFQLSKGQTEINTANLSKKALERDIPIAAAQAFKNACQKLGNLFGRHLNRDLQADFQSDENMTKRIFEKE